jgi:hypothetical protein
MTGRAPSADNAQYSSVAALEQLPRDSGATESGAETCEASGVLRWCALIDRWSSRAWRRAGAGAVGGRS